MPKPIAGIIRSAVVKKIVFRAGDADEKGAGNPQCGPGETGDGGERKQLGLGEGEPQIEHLHRDDAPVQPNGKSAQEARDRDPKIQVANAHSGGVPESVIFDIPSC